MGSTDFRKSETLNLHYNHFDTLSVQANIAAGMRFNRFAFGLAYWKEFSEYTKYSEPENDNSGNVQSLESFISIKDGAELWTSYTITINPDWSSHSVFFSYQPLNVIEFEKGPIVDKQKFRQSELVIGYKAWIRPVGLRFAKIVGGYDSKESRFTQNGYSVGIGFGAGIAEVFCDYISENFEDKLITRTTKIGVGVWY